MYGSKLCLGLVGGTNISGEEMIKIIHNAGFDGFFSGWNSSIQNYKKKADELGMIYQSIHAPFARTSKIWQGGKDAESVTNELVQCVEDCARVEVPILVVHPNSGVEMIETDPSIGLENFGKVVSRAEALGVKIAIENICQEDILDILFDHFKDSSAVGFCWDTGHEMCYTLGRDQLARYGSRLIATHFNDNLGKTRENTPLTWHDDLHLLPFDGIINWQGVADRLNACGYNGILTFEVSKYSRPNRFDNEKYAKLSAQEYVAECYARACRLAYMKNGM